MVVTGASRGAAATLVAANLAAALARSRRPRSCWSAPTSRTACRTRRRWPGCFGVAATPGLSDVLGRQGRAGRGAAAGAARTRRCTSSRPAARRPRPACSSRRRCATRSTLLRRQTRTWSSRRRRPPVQRRRAEPRPARRRRDPRGRAAPHPAARGRRRGRPARPGRHAAARRRRAAAAGAGAGGRRRGRRGGLRLGRGRRRTAPTRPEQSRRRKRHSPRRPAAAEGPAERRPAHRPQRGRSRRIRPHRDLVAGAWPPGRRPPPATGAGPPRARHLRRQRQLRRPDRERHGRAAAAGPARRCARWTGPPPTAATSTAATPAMLRAADPPDVLDAAPARSRALGSRRAALGAAGLAARRPAAALPAVVGARPRRADLPADGRADGVVPAAAPHAAGRPVRLPPGFACGCCSSPSVVVGVAALGADPAGTVAEPASGRLLAVAATGSASTLALTVLLLYAGNLTEAELPQRRLVRLLGWLFVVTVAGGLLGMFAGTLRVHLAGRDAAAARRPRQGLRAVAGAPVRRADHGPRRRRRSPARPRPGATPTPGATTSACWWSGSCAAAFATATRRRTKLLARGLPGGLGRAGRRLAQPRPVDRPRRRRPSTSPSGSRSPAGCWVIGAWSPARRRWPSRWPSPRSATWSPPGSTTASPTACGRSSSSARWPAATESPLIGFGSTRNTIGGRNSITVGESADCERCGNFTVGGNGQLWQLLYAHGLLGTRRLPRLLRLRPVALPARPHARSASPAARAIVARSPRCSGTTRWSPRWPSCSWRTRCCGATPSSDGRHRR